MQEQKGEERIVARVKADVELGLTCLYEFFDCVESDCVKNLGIIIDFCENDWTSTGRPQAWQKDAVLDEETCSDRRRPGTPEFF